MTATYQVKQFPAIRDDEGRSPSEPLIGSVLSSIPIMPPRVDKVTGEKRRNTEPAPAATEPLPKKSKNDPPQGPTESTSEITGSPGD